MTNDKALKKLDEILTIRHQIAHTGESEKILSYEENFEYMQHLYNLAYILQYTIEREIFGEISTFELPHPDNVFENSI